ncbi:hypothetical protein C5167_001480 [Papaver somniferum]|uniref:Uncharacterized protein n=1 Tax=Papaver somniferum TaxID=3469 RepID=A0A4Y7KY87_PAPSO|nr:hypothetical protein C5167_001480 [Papaver somniferum]
MAGDTNILHYENLEGSEEGVIGLREGILNTTSSQTQYYIKSRAREFGTSCYKKKGLAWVRPNSLLHLLNNEILG